MRKLTLVLVVLSMVIEFGYGQIPIKRKKDTNEQSQTVQTNSQAKKKQNASKLDNVIAVDLGLSVKWGNCNVGAQTPYGYGAYFAWGETAPKSKYTSENHKIHSSNIKEIGGISKYDAARANWSGGWRMPTVVECEELINKCSWKWTTYGGIKGYTVTAPNGNSIFLPAAGSKLNGYPTRTGSDGLYWCSESSSEIDDASAINFRTTEYLFLLSTTGAYIGGSVRPVLP